MESLLNYTFIKKLKTKKEYYMDTLAYISQKLGYKLDVLEVSKYVSWGSHHEVSNYMKLND